MKEQDKRDVEGMAMCGISLEGFSDFSTYYHLAELLNFGRYTA